MYSKTSASAVQRSIYQLAREVQAQIEPTDVLDYFEAEHVYEQLAGDGHSEFIHSCLLERVEPHHTNGDETPSSSLSEHFQYQCWTRGGFSFVNFLLFMAEEDEHKARGFLNDLVLGALPESPQDIWAPLQRLLNPAEAPKPTLPDYHPGIIEPWAQIHPYMLRERGISEDVCHEMQIGYDTKECRITIPVFWEHKLVGWQKRSLNFPQYPKTPPIRAVDGSLRVPMKYQNSPQFPRKHILYNGDGIDFSKPVFVVESPVSVLKGKTYGGEFSNIVATFGSKVSNDQIKWLRQADELIYAFDPDYAGDSGTLRLLENTIDYAKVSVMRFPEMTDFADLTRSNLSRLRDEAETGISSLIRLKNNLGEKSVLHQARYK